MRTSTAITDIEARVLMYALDSEWAPIVGYPEFRSAVEKLKALAGGPRCRDCTGVGITRSHLGGWVCAEHRHALDH